MNSRDVRRWMVRLGLLGLAGAFTLGCPERADEITESATEPSFDFAVARTFVTPSAPLSVDRLTLADFDLTGADPFGQKVEGERGFGFASGLFDCCTGWDYGGAERDSRTDPRLPTIVEDDISISGPLILLDPSGLCGSPCALHNPFVNGTISGLVPNETYVVAMVRYGLTVNGESDIHLESLDRAIDASDQLAPLGGAPAGDPSVAITSFPTIVPFQVDANPYILGQFTANSLGEGGFDVVISAPGVVYENISGDPDDLADNAAFDSTLVALNDDTPTDLPRYNYIVIFQGDAVDAADAADNPTAIRFQIGQDIDAGTGQPLARHYAPNAGGFTIPELVAAPGGAGRPDSVTVTFNRLEELAGGSSYTAWLLNENTGDMIPAQGTYQEIAIVADRDPISGEILTTADSLGATTAGSFSFAGGFVEGERVVGLRHQLTVSDATLPGGAMDTVGFYTHLILSVDDAPGDASPSNSRPFFFRFTDQNETPNDFFDDSFLSGTMTFGNVDLADPSDLRVYNGSGFGTGGFREDELSVDLQALSRPPVGYQLVAWLIPDDGSSPFRLPDITGPPPARVNLTDADVSTEADVVTMNGILDANFHVFEGEAGISFPNFSTFVVTLEPKVGIAGMGPVRVYSGSVPDDIADQDEGEG